jgi:hypothetical protein
MGCNGKRIHADYALFDSEAVVLLENDESLVVLLFPSALVEGYSLYTGTDKLTSLQDFVNIPPRGVFGTDKQSLARLKELSETLARETQVVEAGAISDQMRLDAIFANARDLRKTALNGTLQRLSGLDSVLDRFLDVEYCHVYDLGKFITIDKTTDWEALKNYFRQWLDGALLLDRRRNIP